MRDFLSQIFAFGEKIFEKENFLTDNNLGAGKGKKSRGRGEKGK